MDLSKAFDCTPRELLVSKLEAYGVQPISIFILSYDSSVSVSAKSAAHRKPPAKEFSVLCFSMFLLMIYFILSKLSCLQITDDNSLSYASINFQIVKLHLEREAEKCILWFAINRMKANQDKFQAILLNCESEGSHCLYVNGCSIEPLGVKLDNRLVFKHHTNELCKKTGRQVNALKHQSRCEDGRFQSFHLEQFSVLPSNMAPLLSIKY